MVFPHFGGLGSRKSKQCKGPWKWQPAKERVLQNRRFWRFSWKQEIQELLGPLEMATGKGAGIAKSAILELLSGSSHFGGLGSRKSKKYKEPWKWPPEKECFGGVPSSGPYITAWKLDGSPKSHHCSSVGAAQSCRKMLGSIFVHQYYNSVGLHHRLLQKGGAACGALRGCGTIFSHPKEPSLPLPHGSFRK